MSYLKKKFTLTNNLINQETILQNISEMDLTYVITKCMCHALSLSLMDRNTPIQIQKTQQVGWQETWVDRSGGPMQWQSKSKFYP